MAIILLILGLFFGSFFLVVIDRIPRGESILFGRSHCDMCGHTLGWFDLIPLLSYVLLRGKCRYCHKSYGFSYPVVELMTAVVWASTPFLFHIFSMIQLVLVLCIVSCLLIIFFSDMFFGIIPDIIVLIGSFCSIIFVLYFQGDIVAHLLSALCSVAFFLALYFLTKKRGIGFGDVKYAAFMGILLGYPQIIVGLYAAFLTGAAIAFILIIGRRKKFKKDTIAFGPFLVLGTYVAWVGGINLWHFILAKLFNM